MTNAALASAIRDLADFIALDGGDPHRVAHYRGAATAIRRFEHSIAEMIVAGADLTQVPGIGKGLAGFMGDLVDQGSSPQLEAYLTRVPVGLLDVLHLDGVGATRARTLWRERGVESVADLEAALRRGLRNLDGFGPGTESRLRRSLRARKALQGKSLLSRADRVVRPLITALQSRGMAVEVSGELRRRLEIVGPVDVVATATAAELWTFVSGWAGAATTGAEGDNPLGVVLEGGVEARLVAAPARAMGAVSHHLTGPAEYIAVLEDVARLQGFELTPLGLTASGRTVAESEPDMYEALGLPWIPPELRADGTTLDRAADGLPELVQPDDIKGDLHLHTTWSDGAASVERMVRAGHDLGYRYIAITDHSPSTGPTGGLDSAALQAQAEDIRRVRELFPGIHVLHGCEVDILPDGSLDLDDETLEALDVVLVSVHSGFEMDERRMTDRIIRAMRHPRARVLCHPTGRKLGRRDGYPVHLPAILQAAKELDVAIEVNGNPRRLDLDHSGLWRCEELGVNVVISSDAHSVARLDNVGYGVDQARRAWLQRERIVNTRGLEDVLRWLRRESR